jgi:glutathione peroxidase
LKTLLAKYNSSGFQVMAFPCNQFGAQAPCSSDCERAYMYHKVGLPEGSFPIFDKIDANGPQQPETYAVLKNGATTGHDAGFDVSAPRSLYPH